MFNSIINLIDNLTEYTGRLVSWFVILMAVITAVVVIIRYGFDAGSIALQELVTYLHASVFLLGAAYALKHGSHVRVDIFYQRFSNRQKAWVNSVGTIIFLLPLTVFVFCVSWDFVANSWAMEEASSDTGGLAIVYLLKSLILLMAATLFLQGLAEVLRNLLTLVHREASEGNADA